MVAAYTPVQLAFLGRVGAELREFREAAKLTQQDVADLYGWGRDAIKKVEMGERGLSVAAYIGIVRYFAVDDFAPPTHPAVALAEYFATNRIDVDSRAGTVGLYEFLTSVAVLRGSLAGDHPAVALADRLLQSRKPRAIRAVT